MQLILFTRPGCCLCEGLAKRLALISLPFSIILVNIDKSSKLKLIYNYRVPVLAQRLNGECRELAVISPRLKGTGLMNWLTRNIEL
uniref:Glutaredoxin-like protein n=1 Tax=Paulinella chromatophora TaxID=39717 RepID=B1X5C1_PAUCH|nr:ribonucleotide reductase (Class II) [Paulinella chromatophora]ACB43140.1 ribonucleotide reductase (Class II) [Paulinella chromatophora]